MDENRRLQKDDWIMLKGQYVRLDTIIRIAPNETPTNKLPHETVFNDGRCDIYTAQDVVFRNVDMTTAFWIMGANKSVKNIKEGSKNK